MYIKNIKISNFRNILNCNIYPDEKINIIHGKNAQGKTNLIETIYFSSVFKSFRTTNNVNLVNKENTLLFISLIINNNNVENLLKISLDLKKNKKITINNKKPENSDFYKILNSIIYFPDEISYLKAYPSYRRNLIDRSIFFINKEYLNIFNKYLKCLKQRNIFLKSNRDEIDIWKDKLIEYAYLIISERIKYVKRININFDNSYYKNNIKEKYMIKYNKYSDNNIKDNLEQKFKIVKDKEIKYGYTLVGPHIDDFVFLINDSNLNKYSSEGQKKSLLLNYKQAQLQDYKENYGYYPILLFDDIGNELDTSRKKNIFNKILENSGQVFITTTELSYFSINNNKIFEVNNGEFF